MAPTSFLRNFNLVLINYLEMEKKILYSLASLVVIACSFTSCKQPKSTSDKTGMAYNKKEYGGFAVNNKFKRGPGPGLVEIEGGVFVMSGSAINTPGQELSTYNRKRETTVSSFYMDETEVSNTNWLEYLNWIRTNYPADYEYYYNELPDTLVWRRPLSYNEPYVDNYLRHPAYQDYPVVGVSWEQADRYCAWRTDRVNELLLRDQGYMTSFQDLNGTKKNASATTPVAANTAAPTGPFNTDIYLNGQYDDKGKKGGLQPNASFVVLGDQNASPVEGDAVADGIKSLLAHPKINSSNVPESKGGAEHTPNNPFSKNHTAFWRMRADYVLPSHSGFKYIASDVFWPAKGEALSALVEKREASSDHRLVWVKVNLNN